jgi:hypothetical protein
MRFNKLHSLIEEGVNDENYYHIVDTPHAAGQIMRLGYIPMSFSGTSAEGSINKQYPYFLSVSRVPTNDYRGGYSNVTLVLDARGIRSRYKVVPVNYYYFISRKDKNEAEDRILSKKDKLPVRYLKEVHMLAPEEEMKKYPKRYNAFLDSDIADVFVYETREAYLTLDKRKAMSFTEFFEKYKDLPDTSFDFGSSEERTGAEVADLVEFLIDGGKNPETPLQQDWRRNYLRGWGQRDAVPHFSNIIHNAHRNKGNLLVQRSIRQLTRYMKQEFPNMNYEQFLAAWIERYAN